ncbi:Rieske 2Fe-2S domain-containing protein [Nitrospirillum iridis]|uniref:Phenylpropionate dioxygenase-like ring-hydroxylating dioxygenase large terminal subunit n=1 Tax=Nitrospirillum iridis TaxID=765888 RepID=A0A7X0EDI5_9PROT|nr:Rieske 2Fe-2S domain-containing protein [Nitrospirillum iridis]MBB6252135.1 phenylpropionate dioxygenase-like ring-hydroxylating dioxygenase large terminal subunit [Nitrospirillum iridis]
MDDEIPSGGLLSRTIINIPLVFWRTDAGNIAALENRCCHWGAKLSLGRVENGGDRIRCPYHGLLFDRTGQCVSAPAQERVPARAKVRSFPVIERHRWVRIWMADPAQILDTR